MPDAVGDEDEGKHLGPCGHKDFQAPSKNDLLSNVQTPRRLCLFSTQDMSNILNMLALAWCEHPNSLSEHGV